MRSTPGDTSIREGTPRIYWALAERSLRERLEGCAGRLIGNGERAIITVRAEDSVPRQRFTAAHELGHWVQDRRRLVVGCAKIGGGDQASDLERRADAFAAELLMPTRMVRSRCRGADVTLGTCEGLARTFRTSLTATALRYLEVERPMGLLVASRRGRLQWCRASVEVPPAVRFALRTDLVDDRGALAGEAPASGAVSAATWFGHPDADVYRVWVDSRTMGGNQVLTMLWFRDERIFQLFRRR